MPTKLNAEAAEYIRMLSREKNKLGNSVYTARIIAEMVREVFGVDVVPEQIRRVIRGDNWRAQPFAHVGRELSDEEAKRMEEESADKLMTLLEQQKGK